MRKSSLRQRPEGGMEKHLSEGHSWQRKNEYKDSEVPPNKGDNVNVSRL